MNSSSLPVKQMWEFVASEARKQLAFLETEYSFAPPQTKITPRQCSVEFTRKSTTVGVWSEYGTKPSLFIKIGAKRVFIGRLIAKRCPKMKSPVPASVFGQRFSADDYRAVLAFFAEVLRKHACDLLSDEAARFRPLRGRVRTLDLEQRQGSRRWN